MVVLDHAFDQRRLIEVAAVAEASSEHPLARPALAAAKELGIEVPAQSPGFEQHAGEGISAMVDGSPVAVGTLRLMEALRIRVHATARESLARMTESGRTGVLVAYDGHSVGLLGVADEIRPDAAAMIRGLREAGIRRIVILTGDDPRVAAAVAGQVGIEEVHASLLPDDKLDLIRKMREEGEVVAMVGDGVNDAPALATADVGIAMAAAGNDVAVETADVALLSDRLSRIVEAVALSRRTLNNLRQNVTIAVLTVVVLLTGVLTGQVHMAGGMLVHEVSVLVVILNVVRLLRTRLPHVEDDAVSGAAGPTYGGRRESVLGTEEVAWRNVDASR